MQNVMICGCPRSGTSLEMRITEKALGKEAILAAEDMPKESPEEMREKALADMPAWARYITERKEQEEEENGNAKRKQRRKRAKDMNPNGYYEMPFCVQGVGYRPYKGVPMPLLEKWLDRLEKREKVTACKIVSQGLAVSDPRYIDKIIYMVRDPRCVAKSQERLGRKTPMNPEEAPEIDGRKVLQREVQMFNQVTIAAAQWLCRHSDIPVLIVNYDLLLDNPEAELQRMQDFVGEGDWLSAVDLIDTSLKRSVPEHIEDKEAEAFAMQLYNRLNSKDFAGIVEAAKARAEDMKDENPSQYWCFRMSQKVNVDLCRLCKEHSVTRGNFIKNMENRRVDWREEPCTVDMQEGLTAEESIAANHWLATSR